MCLKWPPCKSIVSILYQNMVQTFIKLYKKLTRALFYARVLHLNPDSPFLPQVTYLGMALKRQTHSLSHEWINPIFHFPLPHTIKQLRACFGVTGFCKICVPIFAAFSRHLFMLLLINLPPTDPTPLADYLPYLNLLAFLFLSFFPCIILHVCYCSYKV
jgi:hypothetical protein